MTTKNIFKGKTVAEAIENACISLNAPQEQLDIKVIHTGASGIFGLCRQKSTIKATLKKDAKRPEESATAAQAGRKKGGSRKKTTQTAPKAVAEGKTGGPEKKEKVRPMVEPDDTATREESHITDDQMAAIKSEADTILTLMQLPSEVTVSRKQGTVLVHIDGEHIDDVIGEEGMTLESLQYILRKIIRKKFPFKINLNLDAGNFMSNRINELKTLSLKLAAEVKETGKTQSIPSLNPSERRVIHMEIQDDKEVRSRSVGEGLFKKVLIYRPGKGRKSSPKKRRGTRQAPQHS
jgi:spoIIIJ-associated protein